MHAQWKLVKKRLKAIRGILESYSLVLDCLPAKILYYLHSRTQAFLRSYAEAPVFGDAKFYFIDWEEDLTELSQGHGRIFNMATSPFILQAITHTRDRLQKENNKKQKGCGTSFNFYHNTFFHNNVGEKILKLALEHEYFPDPYLNKEYCLDFHLFR